MGANLYDTIVEIINEQMGAFITGFQAPEVLTVLSFDRNQGTANGSAVGAVKISSRLDLKPGITVVGIPMSAGNYEVVGIIFTA